MRKKILYMSLVVIALFVSSYTAKAQQERKYIRSGNKQFDKGDFVSAEVDYLRALDKDSTSYMAMFNLGDALYKQQKYEDALARFSLLAADSVRQEHRPAAFYNLGNTNFELKKYQEAVDEYKNSLRMNPSDTTAKFNLAYAQLMLKNQQQQQNQDDKENKDDKDNQDKKNQDNKENPNEDKKDQDKDKKDQDKKDGDNKDQQPPQQEPKISKDQAEKMLQAIQGNEDKTQQKVKDKKEKGVAVGGSGKNW